MKVLVDTGVWSLAFRHRKLDTEGQKVVLQLQELILEGNAVMTGVIRQEILSGIKHQDQYTKLKNKLRAFDDLPINQIDHESAAEMFNLCRSKGIQGSHIDFLICAIAINADASIFTVDGDFEHYASVIPLRIFRP